MAKSQEKTIEAYRTTETIIVDGQGLEESWQSANVASNFLELNPTEGKAAVFNTEVKLLYDDNNIYLLAYCFDDNPDSILTQLGERDDRLNADLFTVSFDTYNKKLDAFSFSVSASGVQSDSKRSDPQFNAVWESAVQIVEDGWVVELRIPYYAIRFPKGDAQVWKINFLREIRRIRTEVQWALVPKNVETPINYWGNLVGLNHIKDPVRLSLSPYLSSFLEFENNDRALGYGAGADLKLGLNESYTLDMTLLPDFSQVRSDNIVKNLGAFEVVFEEQRPFFQEGVELFNQAGLFYSRRIGGVPEGYRNAFLEVDSNETIIDNPNASNLINVAKVSGRDKNGLGIGVMNALTAPSFATIKNNESGKTRQLQTNPFVNYNIVSLDQNLKNNSSIYIINLNTNRLGQFVDANVSAFGLNLVSKNSTYSVSSDLKISQRGKNLASNLFKAANTGVNYWVKLSKIRGNFKFDLATQGKSPNFNPNDLGVNFATNIKLHQVVVQYNKYNPFWILNSNYNRVRFNLEQNYSTGQLLRKTYDNRFSFILPSFNAIFINMSGQIGDGIDLFESRVADQKFIVPEYYYNGIGVSTNYSKKFALDADIGYGHGYFTNYVKNSYFDINISPIIIINDKLTLRPSSTYSRFLNGAGFAGYFNNIPKYGVRDVRTLTNIFQGKYLFKNNLSLTLRIRHYWSYGIYDYYGDLDEEGYIIKDANFTENANFNFNAFNTDLIFAWQFAPGSFLNVVYKNALQQDEQNLRLSYFDNLGSVFDQGQRNTLTMKLIYFFDVVSSYKKVFM